MSLINSLRDRGVALRLVDNERLSLVNGADLPADLIDEIRANKAAIVAELRAEQECMNTMLLACRQRAWTYPRESYRAEVAIEKWQSGECTDRRKTFLECWPLTDCIAGRIDVSGQQLEHVLDEVFPDARRPRLVEASIPAPVANMAAFAPEPPSERLDVRTSGNGPMRVALG